MTDQILNDDFQDIQSLNSIKLQLSVAIIDFEQEEKTESLYQYIIDIHKTNNYYINVFKHNDLKTISKNSDMINSMFIIFIKALPIKKYKFENIFIIFCDFYDFNYNQIFKLLHNKLQKLLRDSLVKMIGVKQFRKHEQKHIYGGDNVIITTIFDL